MNRTSNPKDSRPPPEGLRNSREGEKPYRWSRGKSASVKNRLGGFAERPQASRTDSAASREPRKRHRQGKGTQQHHELQYG